MNANKQDAGGEVTNPDNVGGQYDRELIALMLEVYASTHEAPMWPLHRESSIREQVKLLRDADSAEAARVRTVCRAAPAGGDARTVPFSDWMEAQHELGELRTMLARSAPAGSGEVEEFMAGIPRALELADRLIAAGPKAAHVSASETHEISEFVHEAAALLRKLQQGAEHG